MSAYVFNNVLTKYYENGYETKTITVEIILTSKVFSEIVSLISRIQPLFRVDLV